MRRREFVGMLGGAAAWPVAAPGQQNERVRRVGVLMSSSADDPESQRRTMAFAQGLQSLGWRIGHNIQVEYRWGAGDLGRYRGYAAELVAMAPDVILATNTSTVRAVQQSTRTLPIVFTSSVDPVGSGLVASLSRPGANVTGFAAFEFGIGTKWLELLKEIAPRVTRVAVLRDSTTTGAIGLFGALQAVAPLFRVDLSPIDVRNADEIESAIDAFASLPNGGLIGVSTAGTGIHRERITALALRHKLPTVFGARFFAVGGGLISYGPDRVEPFRSAADYVNRILRGTKPADLPVQAPVKYKLVINLKSAKALGIEVPPMLLARADEVIE